MATIPFDPPNLLMARRAPGFVDIPEPGDDHPPAPCAAWDDGQSKPSHVGYKKSSADEDDDKKSLPPMVAGPGVLRRSKTMDGNILIVEPDGEPPQAFWLQRKIGTHSSSSAASSGGLSCVRLAYKLQPDKSYANAASTVWQIAQNEDDGIGPPGRGERLPIVAIKMMHSSILDTNKNSSEFHNPLDEISALSLVANYNNNSDEAHIIGSDLVASCSQYVYAVVPHHPDGTLLQFCQSAGSLDEPVARFFFRQILQVRQ